MQQWPISEVLQSPGGYIYYSSMTLFYQCCLFTRNNGFQPCPLCTEMSLWVLCFFSHYYLLQILEDKKNLCSCNNIAILCKCLVLLLCKWEKTLRDLLLFWWPGLTFSLFLVCQFWHLISIKYPLIIFWQRYYKVNVGESMKL